MRTSLSLMVLVAGVLAPGVSSAQDYRDAPREVVRCESPDGRARFCRLDTRGGVRLVRQLSRTACDEGQTWGTARDGVWVDGGCRGEFATGFGWGQGSARVLRCESGDGRSNYCPADTRGGVELLRQLSRSACIRGQSWDADRRGVWVSGGCRAEFQLMGGGRGRGGWGGGYGGRGRDDDDDDDGVGYTSAPQRLRCESPDGQTRHCDADTRGGVRLLRQLSRSACVEGQSWGYDRRSVWVTSGCRGEFETRGGGR